MTGHTPWSEIRRKVEARTAQNGNRLGEHRKRRVPATNWIALATIIAVIFVLGKVSTGQEYVPYNQGTGLVVQQAEICFSPDLSAEAVKLLSTWQRLVNELEAYERGGSAMGEEDALLGQLLYNNHLCATVADFYPIIVIRRIEGYALAKFDEQLGFDDGPFIVAARDVLPDRGI
jgi:hypothetical protein